MKNRDLARDYAKRAEVRLKALDVLFLEKSRAGVVRESQEIVERARKALLRASSVEPPRIHDVSDILIAERERFGVDLQDKVERHAAISRNLRRDRGLAFYGAKDLTPTNFYSKKDAEKARDGARFTVAIVKPFVASRN